MVVSEISQANWSEHSEVAKRRLERGPTAKSHLLPLKSWSKANGVARCSCCCLQRRLVAANDGSTASSEQQQKQQQEPALALRQQRAPRQRRRGISAECSKREAEVEVGTRVELKVKEASYELERGGWNRKRCRVEANKRQQSTGSEEGEANRIGDERGALGSQQHTNATTTSTSTKTSTNTISNHKSRIPSSRRRAGAIASLAINGSSSRSSSKGSSGIVRELLLASNTAVAVAPNERRSQLPTASKLSATSSSWCEQHDGRATCANGSLCAVNTTRATSRFAAKQQVVIGRGEEDRGGTSVNCNSRRPFTPFVARSTGERRRRHNGGASLRQSSGKLKQASDLAALHQQRHHCSRTRRRNADLNWLGRLGRPSIGLHMATLRVLLQLNLALLPMFMLLLSAVGGGVAGGAAGWQQRQAVANSWDQLQLQRQQQQAIGAATSGRIVIETNGGRILRQISPTFWRSSVEQLPVALAQHSPAQQQQQQNVPYKTIYVTSACEWKSNLFVPKSNDIHFAQSADPAPSSALPSFGEQATSQESSVVYETFNTNANNNYQNSRTGTANQQQLYFQQQQDGAGSRTMLSTDSKALILALPIVMSQSFGGYEPACSIRLIVPRNMRILAKLTSRRLTFAQQQLDVVDPLPTTTADGHLQQQALPQLWLNVSQSQFSETEHKIIETAGNVLAFRFLLERFSSKQAPDTRFQVVLTAFQTLSENSDLSGGQQQQQQQPSRTQTQVGRPQSTAESSAQFICDQQRLISAELACDGFKNCQDGHDEEVSTCQAFRHPELGGQPGANFADQNSVRNQLDAGGRGGGGQPGDGAATTGDERPPIWVRVRHWARDTSSLAGFLLGFLLVLILLTCCSCSAYLCYLAWRRTLRGVERGSSAGSSGGERAASRRGFGSGGRRGEQARELGEADALAAQNHENAARLKRSLAEEERQRRQQQQQRQRQRQQQQQQQQRPAARLQSILKKPSSAVLGAQFDYAARQRPAEPPPAVPIRPALKTSQRGPQQRERDEDSLSGGSRSVGRATPTSIRGALSSSLAPRPSGGGTGSTGLEEHFRPTPAKRLTRPTRPVPVVPSERQLRQHQVGEQRSSAVSRTMTTTSSTTGTQRVTTYHYSSGSTRYSESYLQRLAAEQQQASSTSGSPPMTTGTAAAPPSGANVNYSKRDPSPKSSLI